MKTTATIVSIIALGVALAACEKDSGLKVGQTLQDCAAIAPSQRNEAARAVKFTFTKEQAAEALVKQFNIGEAAALECVK